MAQIAATRAAAIRVVRAHIELAKAEANEIKGEILRALALGGMAAASLVLVAFLLPIGLFLFFGEWLFGSLGWGVLHGTELLVAVAVFAVLAAVRSSGLAKGVAIAFGVGLLVTIVFGTNILNTAYRQIATLFPPSADPGDFSFLVGAGVGAAVLGVVGLVLASWKIRTWRGALGGLSAGVLVGLLLGIVVVGLVRLTMNPDSRPMMVGAIIWALAAAFLGLIAGWQYGARAAFSIAGGALIAGGLFGAFTAITFTWHVAIAIGIAVFLGLAPAIAGAFAANGGIDIEALKARYIPQSTIDTTKETIEWAKTKAPRTPWS